MHPRNRHQGHYDFAGLIDASPALADFVRPNAHGAISIDFANPQAVTALNAALLASWYGVRDWALPPSALCPSVPGRADYVHALAELLAEAHGGVMPKSAALTALDIGTGASVIYPIIGHAEYGWRFVATDINPDSLANAQTILDANPALAAHVSLRQQALAKSWFAGVVDADEWFDVSLCNPPFHASAEHAQAGSARKWRNLGKSGAANPMLNFGGQDQELWYPGGEQAFIAGMIAESAAIPTRCYWFSSLVSKADNLPAIYAALKRAQVRDHRTIGMQQGQKTSRFVAWTFLTPTQQTAWRKLRWTSP